VCAKNKNGWQFALFVDGWIWRICITFKFVQIECTNITHTEKEREDESEEKESE